MSFKSIFNAELNFDEMANRFYSLEGKNETVDFASSNGAGKTTILNALAFAIYGTTLDIHIKQEEYQNKNTKLPLTITLIFSVKNNTEEEQYVNYTVIRTLKSLKLYEGEKDVSELTKTATEKKLLNIIGITKDEFFSFTYLTQYSGGNFLNRTASEKLATIREFVFGDELMQIKTSIDNLLKATNKDFQRIDTEIKTLQGSVKSLADVLAHGKVETITAEKYEENKQWVQETKQTIQNITEKQHRQQNLGTKLDMLKGQLVKMKKQAESVKASICPTCGQVMADDVSAQVKHKIAEEAKNVKSQAVNVKQQLIDIKAELDKLGNVDVKQLQEQINAAIKENAEYQSAQKLVEKQKYAESNIEAMKQKAEKLSDTLAEAEEKITTLKALQKYFNSTFIQEVHQTFLDEIENYLNLYCYDLFNAEFKLQFSGNNLELLVGDKPYSYYSGGERQKIDFLFVFAIKYILSSFTDKCTNLLLADEALSAQDSCSFDNCVDLIKQLSESSGFTVILVSHRETHNTSQNKIILTRHEDNTELEIITA